MSVSAITSNSNSAAAEASARIPVQQLGQNDFLKLLVTQLTSQDPMNPQKDTEFIAQMAQFSALEQSKAMTSDMTKLRDQQQVLQANGMIGRAVDLQVDDKTIVHGTVSSVKIEAGTPKLVVDGQGYELSKVLTIAPPAAN
jgi:flagellar basal-body rod modification protein FlgD